MNYIWVDYNPQSMGYIESWLDAEAVKFTGLDDGFRDFYEYWSKEDGYIVDENFWCKVVLEKDMPVAVIAFAQNGHEMVIMEILVAPDKRGRGIGSKVLKELHSREDILGFRIETSEAVVFPGNTASQKAFENAGFQHHYTYEDGSAMLYVYGK